MEGYFLEEKKLLDDLLSDKKQAKIKKWRINLPFLKESFQQYIDNQDSGIDYSFLENNTNEIIQELDNLHQNRIIDLAKYRPKEDVLENYKKGIHSFVTKNQKNKNERIIKMLKNETNN